MAGKQWRFNPITGTMEPVGGVFHDSEQGKANDDVKCAQVASTVPVIKNGRPLTKDISVSKPNAATRENEVSFREKSDLSVLQITDYDTHKVMGYIAGYGLDINFNMEELNSVDRVEQFLEGLKKAFRSIILEKALSPKKL